MLDAPIVQAAKPELYYARVLIVFRNPAVGTDTSPASMWGLSILMEVCLNDNITSFNKSNRGLSTP